MVPRNITGALSRLQSASEYCSYCRLTDRSQCSTLAVGEGRNAVFFAHSGYVVTAFDLFGSGCSKDRTPC